MNPMYTIHIVSTAIALRHHDFLASQGSPLENRTADDLQPPSISHSIDPIAFEDHRDPVYKTVYSSVQPTQSFCSSLSEFYPHPHPSIAMTKQVVFSEAANPPLPFYCEHI